LSLDRERDVRRRERLRRRRRRRAAGALLTVGLVGAAVAVLVFVVFRGGSPRAGTTAAPTPRRHVAAPRHPVRKKRVVVRPSTASVPILMYHVIAPPLPTAPYPGLYVPPAEFAAQMHALAAAGFHAVTQDQVRAAWLGHATLPPRPIVLTFDNGYRTQYTKALPILRRLGWVGVENLQLSGLPPSQGGLSAREVRALVAARWELDTQGYNHADLIRLDAAQLQFQIADTRAILRRRYHVPVNWFCYPSGHYDSAVIAAVRAAGFVGSTTVVPGWASPHSDPYRLPRLRVLGGTTPSALLALVADARSASPPPAAYPAGS
jgi:peptidoglycan/xylan/chitin deacetylase (PgdA/CDA1 family)